MTLSLNAAGKEMAQKVVEVEAQFYEGLADLFKEAPLPQIFSLLWQFVGDKTAGMALARRAGRVKEHV